MQAYRSGQFQRAIEHFRNAIELDPSLLNAKLWLATSFASQYIPGGESEGNIRMGEKAIAQFEEVLKDDPKNVSALSGIASIYYSMKRFGDAKKYQRKTLVSFPSNPEPRYWIGVIDWGIAYRDRIKVRRELGLTDAEKPLPARHRRELAEKNAELVEEGILMLHNALALRPRYIDAMTYMNLLYRERAELQEDPTARKADLKSADKWMRLALVTRKARSQ